MSIRRYKKKDFTDAFAAFQESNPGASRYDFFAQFNSVEIGDTSTYIFYHTSESEADAAAYPGTHRADDYEGLNDGDKNHIMEDEWEEDDPENEGEMRRKRGKKKDRPEDTPAITSDLEPHRFA